MGEDQQRRTDDAVLPRQTAAAPVQRAYDDLRALEVVLELARDCDGVAHTIGPLLSVVLDVVPLLERAQRSSPLDVEELCAVHDLTVAADEVASMFEASAARLEDIVEVRRGDRDKVGALRSSLGPLRPPGDLRAVLDRALERGAEPRLADTASPLLGELRRRVHGTRQSLTSAADRLVRTPDVARALADTYWTDRQGRVVLPVRSDAFSRAGSHGTVSGIIHGSSKTGATLFVEPQALVEAGNAWREAMVAVRAEERRILAALSAKVGEVAPSLIESLDQLVWLDRLHARLEVSRLLGGVEPKVFEPQPAAPADQRLDVEAARHPLMALAGLDVVPNDLRVDRGGALIITGPNAGGKTVALKTLGLCVLMAQAGLRLPTGVPASIPLFRHVVTDVGDDQSIAGGLSTFSAHMGHVRDALERAAEDGAVTLVLLDEVAVGTDPEQGAALAEALLRELVERGATLVITTHYERLKLLASEDPERFFNAAVGFDFEAMRPTFTVRMGGAGRQLGAHGRQAARPSRRRARPGPIDARRQPPAGRRAAARRRGPPRDARPRAAGGRARATRGRGAAGGALEARASRGGGRGQPTGQGPRRRGQRAARSRERDQTPPEGAASYRDGAR